jgi:hypothetical protein
MGRFYPRIGRFYPRFAAGCLLSRAGNGIRTTSLNQPFPLSDNMGRFCPRMGRFYPRFLEAVEK